MALNTFKCNYLTPLHFKGLNDSRLKWRPVLLFKFNCTVIVFICTVLSTVCVIVYMSMCVFDVCSTQWRRQAWGAGARAPWSLRLHANFAAVQTMAVLIFLPSSVSSKLDRQSHQNTESN